MMTFVFAAAPSTLTDALVSLEELAALEELDEDAGALSVFFSLEHPDRPTTAIAAAAAATVTERFTRYSFIVGAHAPDFALFGERERGPAGYALSRILIR